MARPKKNLSQHTADDLVQGAEQIFARDGYARARLEDVAQHAGISRPSLLYHFKSKDELYEAVFAHIFSDLAGVLTKAISSDSEFQDQLKDLIVAFTGFMEVRPTVASLLVREMVAEEGPGLERLRNLGGPLVQHVEDWIQNSGRVRAGVPVRAVIMHIISDTLLRRASPELSDVFWGNVSAEASLKIAMALLVEDL